MHVDIWRAHGGGEMIISWNGAWEASCFLCRVRQKMDLKTGLMRCTCLRCPNCIEPIAEYTAATAATPYLARQGAEGAPSE